MKAQLIRCLGTVGNDAPVTDEERAYHARLIREQLDREARERARVVVEQKWQGGTWGMLKDDACDS